MQHRFIMVYLDCSEMHHGPDSLGDHVEFLTPPRRDQGEISLVGLEGKAEHQTLHIDSLS